MISRKGFSSPIGAFIFLIDSEEEIDAYARMLVFVPYRGFYFLNNYIFTQEFSKEILFSSPIGAFIFLINGKRCALHRDCWLGVFVPYRGFYFLNWYDVSLKTDSDITFSSPIGAFIFLIGLDMSLNASNLKFSSPIGAFIFLIN